MAKKNKKNGLAAALAREKQAAQIRKPNSASGGVNKKQHQQSGNLKKGSNNGKNFTVQAAKQQPNEKGDKHKDDEKVNIKDEKKENGDETIENKATENTSEEVMESKEQQGPRRSPVIPFTKQDKILLIGEGDCSFARSILEAGLALRIKPTNLDSKQLLLKKYPDSMADNIKYLKHYQIDQDMVDFIEEQKKEQEEEALKAQNEKLFKSKKQKRKLADNEDEDNQDYDDDNIQEDEEEDSEDDEGEQARLMKYIAENSKTNVDTFDYETGEFVPKPGESEIIEAVETTTEESNNSKGIWTNEPLFNIDATQMQKSKALKAAGPFDIILFNFPHTGAGIKDQDRNVIAHQKLLVAFFQSCLHSVSVPRKVLQNSGGKKYCHVMKPTLLSNSGKIVVSLFDGLPYSLWDIKGLARKCGLSTVASHKFEWSSFPGYKHRLTGGQGDTTQQYDKRGARFYVFEKTDREKVEMELKKQREKREKNKSMQIMANNLKGKKGKRKLLKMMKKNGTK